MKRKIVIAILVAALILPRIIDGVNAFTLRFITPPEKVLQRFYTQQDLAENQLEDVLILAGEKMIPLLEVEITNREMKRRRYAIGSLQTIGNEQVIPLLESIVRDKSEKDYFRGDALCSIAGINLEYARQIAPQYSDESNYLSRCATRILSGNDEYCIKGRSYTDALFHRYD